MNKMNILIIEDEIKLKSFLDEALKKEGHNTNGCENIHEVENVLLNHDFLPDIIIMDRLLGNYDASSMIQKLKNKFSDCKILVLSAINTSDEKARILDLGADDYMSKPFSLPELLARMRVLGRRTSNPNNTMYAKAGDILIDVKSRIVTVAGKRLDLTHKEYLVLYTFLQEPGKVYNKIELMNIIWDVSTSADSNVVEVTIMNLRKKIEAAASSVKVASKRNIGYWVEA
ncbi:MAG: response regulator transcription factor [Bacteriovoracaceae bacterium]